jgi:hypothetical protein
MSSLVAGMLRSRVASLVCATLLAASWLLPSGGVGLPLCQFRAMTRLPCFGCGLTRSFIGIAHLDFPKAVFYHPGGLVLFPAVAYVAALGVCTAGVRMRAAGWVNDRPRLFNASGAVFAVLLVGYGLARIVWVVTSGRASPW